MPAADPQNAALSIPLQAEAPSFSLGYEQRRQHAHTVLLSFIVLSQILALLGSCGDWYWQFRSRGPSRSIMGLDALMQVWDLISAVSVTFGGMVVVVLAILALAGRGSRRALGVACGLLVICIWARSGQSILLTMMSDLQYVLVRSTVVAAGTLSGLAARLSEAVRASFPLILYMMVWNSHDAGLQRRLWRSTVACGLILALQPLLIWTLLPTSQWVGTANSLWEVLYGHNWMQLPPAIGRLGTLAGSAALVLVPLVPYRAGKFLLRVGTLLLIFGASGALMDTRDRLLQLITSFTGNISSPAVPGAGLPGGAAGGIGGTYGGVVIRVLRLLSQLQFLGGLLLVPLMMRWSIHFGERGLTWSEPNARETR